MTLTQISNHCGLHTFAKMEHLNLIASTSTNAFDFWRYSYCQTVWRCDKKGEEQQWYSPHGRYSHRVTENCFLLSGGAVNLSVLKILFYLFTLIWKTLLQLSFIVWIDSTTFFLFCRWVRYIQIQSFVRVERISKVHTILFVEHREFTGFLIQLDVRI